MLSAGFSSLNHLLTARLSSTMRALMALYKHEAGALLRRGQLSEKNPNYTAYTVAQFAKEKD